MSSSANEVFFASAAAPASGQACRATSRGGCDLGSGSICQGDSRNIEALNPYRHGRREESARRQSLRDRNVERTADMGGAPIYYTEHNYGWGRQLRIAPYVPLRPHRGGIPTPLDTCALRVLDGRPTLRTGENKCSKSISYLLSICCTSDLCFLRSLCAVFVRPDSTVFPSISGTGVACGYAKSGAKYALYRIRRFVAIIGDEFAYNRRITRDRRRH